MNNKTFAVILLACLLIGVAVGALYESYITPTTGETASTSLQLYEMDGTTPITTLDWGIVGEGQTTMSTILENTGTLPLMLSMTTTETYDWLEQTWDQEGIVIQPDTQITVIWTLTLTTPPQGEPFSYDTVIENSAPP